MRFPCISEVRAYWEALRDGRAAPCRSEVDPRGIENALKYAFILERVTEEMARFRLAGRHLNDLMGMEVRGMPLTAFFVPEAREAAARIVDSVFVGPRTAELCLTAQCGAGQPGVEARLLLLPLRSDLGDISRALGCLIAAGPIGRPPRRFALTESRVNRIVVSQPDAPTSTRLPAEGGFAEPPAPFGAAHRNSHRRVHLRLVVTDKE